MTRSKKTSNAVEILRDMFIAGDKNLEAELSEELANLEIAEQIYLLRTTARLTQKQLAGKIDTTDTVISRLESANYDGHSLSMLKKIAAALNKKVKITFVPIEGEEAA